MTMTTTRLFATLAVAALMFTACGDAPEESSNDDENQQQNQDNDHNDHNDDEDGPWYQDIPIDDVRDHDGPIGEEGREVAPMFPENYDPEGNHPLLFLLHGYGSDAQETIEGFDAQAAANDRGVVMLAPEGDEDNIEGLFWNATDTCCDLEDARPDHVGYLTDLIEEAVEKYAVDPEQIFFLGISNGGMMSHRMACDRSEYLQAIISFNGSSFEDPELCEPEEPVEIFHVHATDDEVVSYDGSVLFPPAPEVAERWAEYNECEAGPFFGTSVEVTYAVEGEETDIEWWDGCVEDGRVEFWTINNARHVPLPLADFPELMFDAVFGDRVFARPTF